MAAIYKEDTRVLPAQSVLPNSHQTPSQKPKPSPGPLCPSPANPAMGANHSLIVHSPTCVFFPLLVLAQPPEPVGHCRAGTPPCTTVCNLCVIGHIPTQTLSLGPQVLILRELCLYPGFLSRHHPCKQSFPVVSLETCRHPAP